ncbi:MAG: tetratricopeptide repeat protein [Blastocatellia bacterium]
MYSHFFLLPLLFLTVAFQATGDSIQRHYKAAQDFYSSGKPDQAIAEYRIALGESYGGLGKVLLAEGEYQKAVKALDRAVAGGSVTEATLIDLATACFYIQQYEKAIDPLDKALAKNPRSAAAHHMLGKVHFMLGQFDKAASHLSIALKFAPADFDIGYTFALACLKQKQLQTARQVFTNMVRTLGDKPEVHILIGRAYRETGYLDEAIEEFKKTIALNPKHPGAHYCLGMSYLLKDGTLKLKEAAVEFRAEVALYPEEFLAVYNLGLACVVERKYEEAVTFLEKAARLRPQNSDVYLFLGNAYHGLGQFDKAVEAFNKCISLDPDLDKTSIFAAEVHFLLGRSLVQTGRPEEGEKHLLAARELKAKALTTDRDKLDAYMKAEEYKSPQSRHGDKELVAAGLNAPDPRIKEKLRQPEAFYTGLVAGIHNQMGLIEAERQDFPAAAGQFRLAAEWDSTLRDVNYNTGLACYKAELYKEAIAPLELELKTNSSNTTARHLLGMCYFMADDYAKASELLSEVIPEKPGNVSLYYTLSISLIKQGRVKEANDIIQKMFVMGGDSPQIHILLGQAHYTQNDDVKALDELKKAVAMDSRAPLAHYYSGLIYTKMGKLDEAARELEAELAINPKDNQAKYHLAFVLLSNQQTDRGIRLMREVIELKPDFADARFELGKALLGRGDVDEAIRNLEAAVKLGPDKPHIHYQLGRAYATAGRDQDAQKSLEIYRQLKDKERNRTNP